MRHGRKVARLGRPADQRKALLRGLVTQLLTHGKIKTTLARARAMRKYTDHMITLALKGTLHDRRQALGFIYDPSLVKKMFEQVPEVFGERYTNGNGGGYTKIAHTLPRRGDNAPMAIIELTDR